MNHMFRQMGTVALAAIAALGSLVPAISRGSEEAGREQGSPRELSVDLGGGVKLEMVLIPAGEFLMGLPDSDKDASTYEKPRHRVRITKPFYLGKHPLTQEQWEAVMGNNPNAYRMPKHPVEQVSWHDCRQFLDKLNRRGNPVGKFQMPSEAQWEYACRAGSTTSYCFGDDESKLGQYAWYGAHFEAPPVTHPVGSKKPNAWGLYDMHGHVLEWCADWYDAGYYARSPTEDPTGPAAGSSRVARGGAWRSAASFCRSASRKDREPTDRFRGLGFRVCLVPADK
jgi:formylglycine-generating enzyme required for sulfatase activity